MSRARDRRKRRTWRRLENRREVRPRFLIVCEDGKSAPAYFRAFRLSSAQVIAVGTGCNTLGLVEKANDLRKANEIVFPKDQVWVVFDRNSFPQSDYDNSFNSAAANGILVAHSNECFEVWVLLHFGYTSAPISRAKLPAEITKRLGVKYTKGMEDLYERLLPFQDAAIRNAERLLDQQKDQSTGAIHNCCPSTKVHLLVAELNKHLAR